jgi:hypothetical protein
VLLRCTVVIIISAQCNVPTCVPILHKTTQSAHVLVHLHNKHIQVHLSFKMLFTFALLLLATQV